MSSVSPMSTSDVEERDEEQPKHRHPYLSGNFAPISTTTPLTPCAYTGTIPPDLAGGQYVRNGGNPVTNSDLGRAAHWFDGDGMLSGVLFRRTGDKGTAIQPEFVNQFLLTDVYAYASRDGRASRARRLRRPVLPSIATLVDPCLGVWTIVCAVLRTVVLVVLSHVARARYPIKKISVANTAVLFHDGRALALCESGPPLRFALPGLETIGWFNGQRADNEPRDDDDDVAGAGVQNRGRRQRGGFGGDGPLAFMKEWTTAHPRVDPVTKELIAFHAVFVAPFCYYSVVPATRSGAATTKRAWRSPCAPRFSVPVPGVTAPKMMHDFGASRRHTVVLDLPLTLDPANVARGVPVLAYDAAGRARFGVFPRHRPDRVQWFETSPCVIFHTANCWDDAPAATATAHAPESVSLLACRLTSASLVFSAGNLPTPAVAPVPPEYAEEEQCRLYYYNFALSSSRIRHQWALSAIPMEFPTLSPDHAMGAARFVYGCSTAGSGAASYTVALGKAAKIDCLVKMDVQTLIARGVARPPQPIRGCVDTRSVADVLADADAGAGADDPIRLFRMPDGWYAQEARFVPRRAADRAGEDDGWLLTFVFDESCQLDADGECRADAVSELWIIDARTMQHVVARVRLPQRVPYGLHGAWFPEAEMRAQRPYCAVRTLEGAAAAEGAFGRALRELVERWIG